MRDDLPGGVVTLLLTDIEGSTRLLHRLGAAEYAVALDAHRSMLRAAFVRHAGVEVDTQGDAFFVAFPSHAGAVRAAIDGQHALAAATWPQATTLKVRMGLHTGNPQRTSEGYVGVDVHTAARIAATAHGGQVVLSRSLADRVRADPELGSVSLRDLGEHRLKDIEGAQRLFQVEIAGLASDFPPLRSLTARADNLPVPPTPFVGRTEVVNAVRDLVLSNEVRLVTLTGPGGTGKTRLGLRVASELLHTFADGACFVPLAALRDPGLVLQTIATALSVREEQRNILDTLAAELAPKQLLLLIDNFEQVQNAARDLGALLSRCPRLKILVTSREAVRVSGARAFVVPPLSLPPASEVYDLAAVASIEAVRLFVERAAAVRPDFVLDERNVNDVVAICRRVDALPLAIELAAARIRSMQPDRLLRALDRRLKVLTQGGAELLDHQRTLRDLIAWSYEMLSEDEQLLWRRLAVFAGGCEVTAAQQVCDVDGHFDVELDVEPLVAKSLITVDFDTDLKGVDKVVAGNSTPRYMMLETLREYALERLIESGEGGELNARHRSWFVGLAESAEAKLRGAERAEWMQRLDHDYANLRLALEHSAEAGAEGVESLLRAGAALWFYWYQRGLLTEGREWLERGLAADNAPPTLRARSLLGSSSLMRHQNRLDDAERLCAEAVAIYRTANDREGTAIALSQLGAIVQRRGDFDRASTVLTEALGELRAIGNRERVSFTLVALGVVEHLRGDLDAAHRRYTESLDIARSLHDKNAIATALVNLGEVTQLRGDTRTAATHYRESLRLYNELGLRNAIAYCLEILAGIDVREGRPSEAAELFGAADRIRQDIGTPVESFNLERYQDDLARTRQGMDETRFAEHWNRGRTLSVDNAVELAMRDYT